MVNDEKIANHSPELSTIDFSKNVYWIIENYFSCHVVQVFYLENHKV